LAVSNPRHPRLKEFEEWLDGPFDLEHFDLKEVNEVLSAMSYTP